MVAMLDMLGSVFWKEVVDIPLDAGRDLSRWRMVRVFSFLVGFLSF
jgi:hypothetical protein